ncbi:MAG: glycosyltransferase [Dehalococcoidales bacterium]
MKEMLSVIIPTYNEKDNIAPLVKRIHQALSGHDYEIVIVDDNSQDGTIEIVKKLTSQYPVKLFVRREERGLATAVIHGIKQASGNIIGVIDADLQHPPEVLPRLLGAVEGGADMVFASRYIEGGGCPNWGLSRRIVSKVALQIAHIFLPSSRQVKDPLSGFFMFRREKVDVDKLKPIGYKIALEIMLVGSFKNIVEVPFLFEERSAGQSKLRPQQQIDYLKHIFSLMSRTGEFLRFVKFIAVGLTGTAVNLGVLKLVTVFTTWNDKVQLIPGIEVSIITNFLLNDFFTFADRRTGKTASFFGRMLKYNLLAFAGAFINWGVAALMVNAGVNIYLSDFVGILIAFLWNYFFSTIWAWK